MSHLYDIILGIGIFLGIGINQPTQIVSGGGGGGGADALLLENGNSLLLESGDSLLLE